MSQFEFIAVFVSIIFGLSLTQILSGALHLAQHQQLQRMHLGWTLFVLYVLTINWWTFFPWSQHEVWAFEEFLIIVIWALAHYVMAIALYPRRLDNYSFNEKRSAVMWAFLLASVSDMAQTAARGAFFDPWYYAPFVLFLMACTAIGLLTKRDALHEFIPWFLVVAMLIWSFVVRRLLT